MNLNIPVVTDREHAMTNVFLELTGTKENHFCCTSHIISDAKLKARSLFEQNEAQFHINAIYNFVRAKDLQEYLDSKEEVEKSWDLAFKNYFDTFLHPALEKNFKQLGTKRYPCL